MSTESDISIQQTEKVIAKLRSDKMALGIVSRDVNSTGTKEEAVAAIEASVKRLVILPNTVAHVDWKKVHEGFLEILADE
jgi:hypothetical protein